MTVSPETVIFFIDFLYPIREMCYTVNRTTGGITMILAKTKKISLLYPLLAFLIPFIGIITVMIIRGFAPFGTSSMLYSDMYHQYYPFFVSFRRALLSGDSLLYNWDIGMGINYFGLIAYYLASPLNLLSVFVPESQLLSFFSLLVPIKLGLVGLFFSIFLRKIFNRNDFSVSLFSAFYGLCAWALAYQWNVIWLDTFALLPLVVLGAISLLRDKKFILYTTTLFISVLANYYIGLFTCIFVVLVFICYEFCHWQDKKHFFADFARIALFSILAIGMTAFLELPAYMALQSTQSAINNFPQELEFNIADSTTWTGLFDALRQVAGNTNGGLALNLKDQFGLPNLYCGIICSISLFLFLTSKFIPIRERICGIGVLLFLSLSFIIRQLDYMWHGFHFTNMIPYRFSFLYSFVMLYIAYRAFNIRRTLRLWQIISAAILALAIMFCGYDVANATYWVYNIVFIAFYTLAFLIPHFISRKACTDKEEYRDRSIQRKEFRAISTLSIWGVMCIELVVILIFFGIQFTGVDIDDLPEGRFSSKQAFDYIENTDQADFYRTEVTQTQTLNDGALNGYNGITAFTSSASVNITHFAEAMGLSAKDSYNRYSYQESSPVTNLFLNLQYLVERNDIQKENSYFDTLRTYGIVKVMENKAYLPLGFMTNNALLDLDFQQAYQELDATHGNWNNLSFQNKLFSAATGVSDDVWDMITGKRLSVTATGVTIGMNDGTATRVYEAKNQCDGTVTYRYVANKTGYACLDLYIGLYDSNYTPINRYTVYKNGNALYSDNYSLPFVLGVADVVPGDIVEIKIDCYQGEHGLITAHCGILNDEVFQTGYDILNHSTYQIASHTNTKITGTIACEEDGLMYTSIPQDGNWVAIVDGKEVEPILIGDAMIGLTLSKGTHTVTFTYQNKSFTIGIVVSFVCLAIFATICIIHYKKNPGSL